MAILVFTTADGTRTEYPLQAVTRVGTNEDNDIRLLDASASPYHCEVRVEDGRVMVLDLGSASGTSIDGEPIQQGALHHGATLRVGEVQFLLENQLQSEPPAAAIALCRNHPGTSAAWRCSKCRALFCSPCVADGRKFGVPGVKFCPLCSSRADNLQAQLAQRQRADKSLAKELLAAWKYSFHGEGLIILIAGTAFLALAGVAQRFAFIMGGFLFVGTTGYLMAYSQKIITATANGEDLPPSWPDFTDFFEDMVVPFFQALGLFLIYLLPFFVARGFLPEGDPSRLPVSGALLFIALFMMPMAWLAISMHDSLAGLSPRFVIPSILRISGDYLVVFFELVLLVGVNFGLSWALEQVKVPIVPWLLNSFLGLYFLMIISRVLGILYYVNRDRLGWFKRDR